LRTNLAGVDPLAGECVVVGPHFDGTVSLVVGDEFDVVVTNSSDVGAATIQDPEWQNVNP